MRPGRLAARVASVAVALSVAASLPGAVQRANADALVRQGPDLPALPAETVVLANGLRVFLAPDPRATLVSVRVAYGAGKADDPMDRPGVAMVSMFLALDHTLHVPSALRTLAAVGGTSVDSNINPDTTAFFETVAPERLETALWVESDRMGYSVDAATEANVDAARRLAENAEDNQHKDTLYGAVPSFLRHELYPAWHPYAAVEDTEVDYSRVGADDVRLFLANWYTTGNATVAIAGRFDRDAALALVKRYFESLPTREPPARSPLPSWETPARSVLVKANVFFDQVVVEWRTPAYGTAEDAALDLAASALGRSQGETRLARALLGQRLATTVSARQVSRRDGSVFNVTANCAPGVDHALVVRTIQQTIDEFAKDATVAEAAHARGLLRSLTLTTLESTWGRAARLIEMGKIGEPVGPQASWGVGRYDALTEVDVRAVAYRWLNPDHSAVATVTVDRNAPKRGRLERREGSQ